MERPNYDKLRTRLSGAIYNAINKDPDVTYSQLKKAFFDVCHKFINKKKLFDDSDFMGKF